MLLGLDPTREQAVRVNAADDAMRVDGDLRRLPGSRNLSRTGVSSA